MSQISTSLSLLCFRRTIDIHLILFRFNDWLLAGSRPKRPLSSVVLDTGIKNDLLEDCKDFMDSEMWYAERGIPWRRGYLLYGCPGSGKTSLSTRYFSFILVIIG